MMQPVTWQSILTQAIQAPSPHNTQPWRVRIVDDRQVELYLDQRRMLDADTTGCFQVSAGGIFIEAVSLVAAHHGLRLEVHRHAMDLSAPLIPLARLRLEEDPSASSGEFDPEQLAERRTSRLSHTGHMIDGAQGQALIDLTDHYGQRFGYTSDDSLIGRVLARNTQAILDDMGVRSYREEFVDWLRPNQPVVSGDGMTLDAMRMSTLDDAVLRRAPWMLKLPGARRILTSKYKRALGQTDHIGWFAGPFFEPAMAIDAGRFLLRFWLMLSDFGIGMHPLGNLVTHPGANAWTGRELVGGPGVWLVFRFGNSKTPPKSSRLPLSEVLLD